MFSQELLTNGELNHFSLKERMVEIGKRWQKLSQAQKDKYKKQVEEQQVEYKAHLEAWVKVSPAPSPQVAHRPRSLLLSSAVAVPTGPRRLQGVLLLGESAAAAPSSPSALQVT